MAVSAVSAESWSGDAARIPATSLTWVVVNDGVMGGVSRGRVGREAGEGVLRFEGVLSLANNGGFASIRSVGIGALALERAEALMIRVRGDGRRYQLRAYGDGRFRGREVAFVGEFDTVVDTWIEVRVPIREMQPRFRGVALQGPPLEAASIRGLGLMLADKREGPFAIEVEWIGGG